jgi:hypothetical protein
MDLANKFLMHDQVKFFSKWLSLGVPKIVSSKWANFLIWRITLDYPDKKLFYVLNEGMNSNSKKILFKKSLGSLKLYLLMFVWFTYIKGFIHAIKFITDGFITSLRKTIWIS